MKAPSPRLSAVSVAALAAAMIALPVSAAATAPDEHNPPGNNGTIKIDGPEYDDGLGNEPHVACTFRIRFFGFDDGQRGSIEIDGHAPSGSGRVGGLTDVLLSDDDAGGGTDVDAVYEFSANDLQLAGLTAHPKQGYHLKVTIRTGEPGGVKHKVLWLAPCQPAAAESTPASSAATSSSPASSSPASSSSATSSPATTSSAATSNAPSSSTGSTSAVATTSATSAAAVPTTTPAPTTTTSGVATSTSSSPSVAAVVVTTAPAATPAPSVLGVKITRADDAEAQAPAPGGVAARDVPAQVLGVKTVRNQPAALPFTGVDATTLAAIGLVLITVGAVAVRAARRRRYTPSV